MTSAASLPKHTGHHGTRREKEEDTTTNLRSLALPWFAIVIASAIAAVIISCHNHGSHAASTSGSSSLRERLLATGINDSSLEHHQVHKPVYEENHKPLLPLSKNDKVGFSLAIAGLMIAAGGGKLNLKLQLHFRCAVLVLYL